MLAQPAKDFLSWHTEKQKIHNLDRKSYFSEKEIWWCSVGLNIGSEQDGWGQRFSSPILIFKKFAPNTFWGIPLTSKIKTGSYYYTFFLENGVQNTALLNQLRLFDGRRLIQKMGFMSDNDFFVCKKRLLALCASNQ